MLGAAMRLKTVLEYAADLAAGRTTSVRLLSDALARIEDPKGEGARAFLKVNRGPALAAASASDALRAHGIVPSPIAGLPVSIKDLFDVQGEVTGAGSPSRADAPPAKSDAVAVARLRAAGAINIGRTNMVEFAFGGIGTNPHYGTPGNPHDRTRVPGGSTSGGAVSVADGMAVVALGSDTGGSVRTPSAFCGLAGFKPTQERVPREGAFPLSWSLDSVGPLAPSMTCCAIVDAILAGEAPEPPAPASLDGLRFGVPVNYVLDGMDAAVARAWDRTLALLSRAGAKLIEFRFSELDELPRVNAKGGLATYESYAVMQPYLARGRERIDPKVALRVEKGAAATAVDYIEIMHERRRLMAAADARTAPFDAVITPTVPIVAPKIAEVDNVDDYFRFNPIVLRNCNLVNFLDRCAASVPMHQEGELASGFQIIGEHMADKRTLAIAIAVERSFSV
jgi:aspartyl-tRNA(Asn)/glutamyl-tRNA(Gln) amidotransferase subunit A